MDMDMDITQQGERSGRGMSILMLPWLAHGHISPFLELAKKLTTRNFYIYFCSTPVNLNSIKHKITPKYSLSIQFVELHVPPILPHLPPHYHTTNGLPPHLMPTLKTAFDTSTPNFSNILETLKPNLVIYDFLQPWAPAIASSLNIPAVEMLSTGAAVSSYLRHFAKNPGVEYPFPEIFIRDYEKVRLSDLLGSTANGVRDQERTLECARLSTEIILIKTFREIEGKYIDYLSILHEKKLVPLGPLVQNTENDDEVEEEQREEIEIMEWLNKKDRSSTVFVSFGSEYFLSKEEIEEIAHGLELSKVNFIWVVRFPVGEKIRVEEVLPQGFLERVGERGRVVEGWAPQMKILGHRSIGGFVSHCGWSSVMEGMKFGVPIITMPMHLDQPFNARVVVNVGVGMEVERNSKSGVLEREEVGKVIRKVVVEEIGVDVRKRAREMSEKMRDKEDEEMDGVVKELLKLCDKNNK